ncbi:MAG: hypothetical protein TR69_WS6001000912 [candidate division WS6 bacterium OLB20]|uniref:Nucleoside 2-deoxyribosyltransferase n=1 Tax=candidate division WS6 bacterium OLB20 TaxID=1617426 RepID=A0A136LZ04_9BACT|nr:MAG: hypothetical protein TR69_WS6001000912 [candidate division WS6 bacterium OLB20]
MKIYVAHSSGFDFKNELYRPLHDAAWSKEHEVVFPHEHSSEQYDSRSEMRSFDLVIAEVSYPSTGMGIELGWADSIGIPVVAVVREDAKPSGVIAAITKTVLVYTDGSNLAEKLGVYLAGLAKA